jgi:solute carrier family 35 protein E3
LEPTLSSILDWITDHDINIIGTRVYTTPSHLYSSSMSESKQTDTILLVDAQPRRQVRFANSVPDSEQALEEQVELLPVQTPRLPDKEEQQIIAYLWTASAILLNIGSSVGVVMVNKLIFQTYHFNFGTLLTVIHFICTWFGLMICSRFGAFTPKSVSWKRLIKLSASFCGFVVLTNLSLQYNSVGFYQMAKVLTTPTVATIQTIFYGKQLSTPIIISLAVICIGVTITSVTDVQMNLIGTIYALSGVLITSLYQVWVGSEQKALQLSPPQLLYQQAPLAALMLLPCVPMLDSMTELLHYPFTLGAIITILLSGLLAFLVNWSIFSIIGRTSALTYNVVGHAKLCLILLGGFLLFHDPLEWRNLSGIGLALVGIFAYSKINLQEAKQQQQVNMRKD